jgi:1-acyl-sn-glycerol-3-phosphate acyltransferase
MTLVRSIITWLLLSAFLLIAFPFTFLLWIITVLPDRRRILLHRWITFLAEIINCISPFWDLKLTGRENIRLFKNGIVVANHQSMLDILILYRLRIHFKWVSKREVFAIPIIGWAMRMAGYIEVKRNRKTSIWKMMVQSQKVIERGESVLIFPEGTRSEEGTPGHFKDGAFRLATETGKPVLPVVVTGTRNIVPKGKSLIQGKAKIRISVLPPVEPVRKKPADLRREIYTAMMRQWEIQRKIHG